MIYLHVTVSKKLGIFMANVMFSVVILFVHNLPASFLRKIGSMNIILLGFNLMIQEYGVLPYILVVSSSYM